MLSHSGSGERLTRGLETGLLKQTFPSHQTTIRLLRRKNNTTPFRVLCVTINHVNLVLCIPCLSYQSHHDLNSNNKQVQLGSFRSFPNTHQWSCDDQVDQLFFCIFHAVFTQHSFTVISFFLYVSPIWLLQEKKKPSSTPFSTSRCKKVKMTKNLNQGGPT